MFSVFKQHYSSFVKLSVLYFITHFETLTRTLFFKEHFLIIYKKQFDLMNCENDYFFFFGLMY